MPRIITIFGLAQIPLYTAGVALALHVTADAATPACNPATSTTPCVVASANLPSAAPATPTTEAVQLDDGDTITAASGAMIVVQRNPGERPLLGRRGGGTMKAAFDIGPNFAVGNIMWAALAVAAWHIGLLAPFIGANAIERPLLLLLAAIFVAGQGAILLGQLDAADRIAQFLPKAGLVCFLLALLHIGLHADLSGDTQVARRFAAPSSSVWA